MAEKDITEKLLFEAEDVFADILNVLLFNGRDIILPQTLLPTGQRSQLKIRSAIHEQERDVSKLWTAGGVRFALFGLENQTEVEQDMVLRVFSYDGASYKEQVVHNRRRNVEKWIPYPSVTIVLYFGKKRWDGPKTLRDLLSIPPELEPFVNDYRLHVFEISHLSPERVAMFKSDFRIVADFFVQTCQNQEYVPSQETITHVEETLKLMSVLTGDVRFEECAREAAGKGGNVAMCDVLDRAENRGEQRGMQKGMQRGMQKGMQRGMAKGRLNALMELALDGVLSCAEAAARVNLTEQEFAKKMEAYRQTYQSGPLPQ